jgi:hypothetical protein
MFYVILSAQGQRPFKTSICEHKQQKLVLVVFTL